MTIDDSEYNTGRLAMAITMASAPIEAACSAANYLFNAASAKGTLTPGELIALRQYRMRIRQAAATLDEVIEPARPKMVAAE